MTIDISIANNLEYCRANNLIEIRIEPCLCAGQEVPGCHYCTMTSEPTPGLWVEKIYPFDMNIANVNFATLWGALGLDCEPEGEIDGRVLLQAIRSMPEDLLVRSKQIDNGRDEHGVKIRPTIIYCGIDPTQAQRYLVTLTKISEEAVRREEPVVWG